MLEILKTIGRGTVHELSRYQTAMPRRREQGASVNEMPYDPNYWYDKLGISYKIASHTLIITARDYFPDSIVDYINAIPPEVNLNIALVINSHDNEMAGFNMLCGALKNVRPYHPITISLTELYFGGCCSLEVEDLPDNVKISNCLSEYTGEEIDPFYGENSFDWWALNCDDDTYRMLLGKLAPVAKKRAHDLRKIAYDFYCSVPESIRRASNDVKCAYAFRWCTQNIPYDTTAIRSDGNLAPGRHDSQDPIMTFRRRTGVCAGRACLLKTLLNNYYMRVPVFLVTGMSGRLPHEWNEFINDKGTSVKYDLSRMTNTSEDDHRDYSLSENHLREKRTPKRLAYRNHG